MIYFIQALLIVSRRRSDSITSFNRFKFIQASTTKRIHISKSNLFHTRTTNNIAVSFRNRASNTNHIAVSFWNHIAWISIHIIQALFHCRTTIRFAVSFRNHTSTTKKVVVSYRYHYFNSNLFHTSKHCKSNRTSKSNLLCANTTIRIAVSKQFLI